jgi:hypothetical protein
MVAKNGSVVKTAGFVGSVGEINLRVRVSWCERQGKNESGKGSRGC